MTNVSSTESLPPDLKKCPKHKCWIKLSRSGSKGTKHRFCPVCLTEEHRNNPNYTAKAVPTNIRKITL